MDMRVKMQVLPPGMQHRDEADLGIQMSGIGGQRAQRLGDGAKQGRIDRLLILEGNLGDRLRHGEDDVEIADRQQIGLPGGKPVTARLSLALWAMPVATGVIGDAECLAVLTLLDMAAQPSGPAPLDGTHHPAFDPPEMSVMGLTMVFPVAAKNVRHFQSRRVGEASSAWRHHFQRQPVERTGRAADQRVGHLRVARRGRQVVVAEQDLDDADVGSAFQKMSGKAMT